MVLPPLELFSLRKELPCCRAALSVFVAFPEIAERLCANRPDLVTADASLTTKVFAAIRRVWEARLA